MDTLIRVSNFSVQFTADGNTTDAVKNISFDIGAKEIVAIVGESGSGKSVTAMAMLQLLPKTAATSGAILFNSAGGQCNLLSLPEKEIIQKRGKEIAIVFQEPMTSLNPLLTCGRQVIEAIQLHQQADKKVAAQKAIELFRQVHLPNPQTMLNRYPHQLSGGQKQRVMIAMALSCNPALLIADEPTTALDVTVQKEILQLLQQLQQQNGMSILLITHDLGIVADIAHKVVVMYKGQIAEQGTTNEVVTHPRHSYTKGLLLCRPGIYPKGVRLPVMENGILKPAETAGINFKSDESGTAAHNAPVVLEVRQLQVHYPSKKMWWGKKAEPFKAVDDVSFVVHGGETLGLVGESGCGKTTLGRCILQLIPATSGSIILNGTNLAHLSKKEMQPLRKDLQIVFQDPYGSLNPRLTIGEAILEPMQVHGLHTDRHSRKDKVAELLEKVSLSADHFNRYPHQFSGGQRQRICIARALALNPSFLIFDESVSALDVSVQAQVLNLLNDLKKEFGFTAIFISHDLAVVRYISDRIMVMYKGKIVEEGPAEKIYTTPQNIYTQKLLDAVPGRNLQYPLQG
jgi:peptide/nickel transport system ATP-binding protein